LKIIIRIKHKLNGLSSDRKSILTLVGGTTVAQFFNFIFSPIQTRLFSPEVFGELSVFTSIISIVAVIVCLRFELAIVLPKDDEEGFSIYKLSLFFAIIISTLAAFVFLFYHSPIYKALGAEKLSKYWYYVPLSLILTGVIQASDYWLTRERKFKVLSLNKIITVIAVNLVSIFLGLLGYVDLGTRLLAVVISNIASLVIIAHSIIPEFHDGKHVQHYPAKELFRRYKNFFLYDIWGALINSISWMIVPILMNRYYGSFAAGQYAIGLRVIQLPLNLIGASIGQVFLKTASEKKYFNQLYGYVIETTKRLFLFSIPFTLILLVCGRYLFKFIFGQQWEIAGIYVQILAPWAMIWFISNPISAVNSILQKQQIRLIITISNLATRFASLYIGSLFHNERFGLVLFSLSGMIIYSLSLFSNLYYSKQSDKLSWNAPRND